ncbi:MAG: hypothetical protein QOE36_2415, partial [Gaiellaceae bacterium]|nr:hypothetical protein [Gaiellaceae bacterium]
DLTGQAGPRFVEAAVRSLRGETEAALTHADWLMEAARNTGVPDLIVPGLGAVAMAKVAVAPDEARALLEEIERVPHVRENLNYPTRLPAMVRTALAAGDSALARRLAEGVKPRFPLNENALCAAHAALAEDAGELDAAAALYDEAAGRWEQFGNVPERAFALLGHGRVLAALDRAGAAEPLRTARKLFAGMGFRPACREADALLERALPAAS